ncbi:MAG: hypothetical protein ACJAT2_002158 [Bacteriovoracaceae bacterium]|jgi:hypothetical protein
MKENNLQKSLLALRYGVFIVMFVWTVDKFLNPVHTGKVFQKFYLIEGLSSAFSYTLGALQLALVLGFILGFKKRLTYGAILLMHTISTFSSYEMYLNPWSQGKLLFFAAWPMLAAIYALYLMREEDTLLTIGNMSLKNKV